MGCSRYSLSLSLLSLSLSHTERQRLLRMLFGRTLRLSVAFLRVSILFDSPYGTYTPHTSSPIFSFLLSTNLSSIYHHTAHRPRINSARKRQADSREMWINVFVIAEHNFSGNLLSPSLLLYYLTPSLSYSLFFSLRHCCPYLHTIRVACREHERPIQIEYLRETKHASDILLRAHERALLFRKFVSPRTRINARNRPP